MCGAIGHRKTSRRDEIHYIGNWDDERRWKDEFRCKSATPSRESDHALTWPQIHNVRRTLDNFSCSFNAGRERQGRLNLIFSRDHEVVWEIDTSSAHANPYMTFFQVTRLDLFYSQAIGFTEGMTQNNFHYLIS